MMFVLLSCDSYVCSRGEVPTFIGNICLADLANSVTFRLCV